MGKKFTRICYFLFDTGFEIKSVIQTQFLYLRDSVWTLLIERRIEVQTIALSNCLLLFSHTAFIQLEIAKSRDSSPPITVAARSKPWNVFARSNTGFVGLNPTLGIDVCVRLFCVCVVLCVSTGLAMGWSSVQGIKPTVYKIKKLKICPCT
jgi:hypothetical protein